MYSWSVSCILINYFRWFIFLYVTFSQGFMSWFSLTSLRALSFLSRLNNFLIKTLASLVFYMHVVHGSVNVMIPCSNYFQSNSIELRLNSIHELNWVVRQSSVIELTKNCSIEHSQSNVRIPNSSWREQFFCSCLFACLFLKKNMMKLDCRDMLLIVLEWVFWPKKLVTQSVRLSSSFIQIPLIKFDWFGTQTDKKEKKKKRIFFVIKFLLWIFYRP